MKYDVAVVGAGPGGLFAAKHAAALGLSVVLIEKRVDISTITRACCEQFIMDENYSGDTLSIELQIDDNANFNHPSVVTMVLCGAAGAEVACNDDRLSAAGAWIHRGALPYEVREKYLRLYYNNTTSNGTITLDAWLTSQLPQSDLGQQVFVSPVGNPSVVA